MSSFEHLIVDGYNLLHNPAMDLGPLGDLQSARQRLVRRIEGEVPELASRMTIVFDGKEGGLDASLSSGRVEVLFSPVGFTADAVIERMVSDADHPDRILVVTSDRVEEQIVSAAGATVWSCVQFAGRCTESSRAMRSVSGLSGKTGGTLGDFFPESAR